MIYLIMHYLPFLAFAIIVLVCFIYFSNAEAREDTRNAASIVIPPRPTYPPKSADITKRVFDLDSSKAKYEDAPV